MTRMIKRWVTYLIALILSIILARYKAGYVSAMLFYCVLVFPLLNIFSVMLTMAFFKVSHSINHRKIVKGETVAYHFELHNHTWFLFCPISIEFSGHEYLFKNHALDTVNNILLRPFQVLEIHKEITCDYRGAYAIGVDQIHIQDFFGMFQMTYTSLETHKILVYPLIYDLKAGQFSQVVRDHSESVVSFDKAEKSVFADVRPFQHGDGLNRIHWKLSAKAGEWMTKVYEGSVHNQTKVFINTEQLPYNQDVNIILEDQLIEGAVSLIKNFLDTSVPVDLYYKKFEVHHIKGRTPDSFERFYEALAQLSFYPKIEFEKWMHQVVSATHEPCNLIVFTHRLTPELCGLLKTCKNTRFEVAVIILQEQAELLPSAEKLLGLEWIQSLNASMITVYHVIIDAGVCRLEVA